MALGGVANIAVDPIIKGTCRCKVGAKDDTIIAG